MHKSSSKSSGQKLFVAKGCCDGDGIIFVQPPASSRTAALLGVVRIMRGFDCVQLRAEPPDRSLDRSFETQKAQDSRQHNNAQQLS